MTLPHPRDRKSEAFTQLVDYIYKVLTRPDELPPALPNVAVRHAGARRAARCTTRCCRMRARAASPACWRLLIDHDGQATTSTGWPTNWRFEIDDLLPIVEAAQMLGFLTVAEGDAEITPAGAEYAESEILRQKELFRKAALDNVLLLRQIHARPRRTRATTRFRRSFSTTCWTSSSAKRRRCGSWKRRSTGAATRSCSTTTPRGGALSALPRTRTARTRGRRSDAEIESEQCTAA